MQAFIKTLGGKARFDHFSQEHLMGEHGFYARHVDLRNEWGGAPTPSRITETYAKAVAEAVFSMTLDTLKYNQGGNGPFNFAEFGGGAGDFKREFLKQYRQYRDSGGQVEIKYISVEPNPHHIEAQQVEGTTVMKGTVQKSGLQDRSIDVLFDDEVLDCLPFRIFKYDPQKRVITHEAFVTAQPDQLKLDFHPAERDEHVSLLEKYITAHGKHEEYHVYSPDYHDYWHESFRVLKPGGLRFSIDYGSSPMDALFTKPHEWVRNSIQYPYQRDLTHMIDFDLQGILAHTHGFSQVNIVNLSQVLDPSIPKTDGLVHGFARHLIFAMK